MARTKQTSRNTPVARSKPTTGTKRAPDRPATAKPTEPAPIDLGGIEQALRAGDGGAALGAALESWRATRSPLLGDLVLAISARVSGPAITTDLEWSKLAATRAPLVLGPLLHGLRSLPVSFLPSAAQRLHAFADDPRIADAAAGWILDPVCTSSSAYPFWSQLFETLERIGDRRILGALERRVKLPMEAKPRPGSKTPKPSQFWPKYYKALARLRGALEALPPPPETKLAVSKLITLAAKLAVVTPDAATITSTATPEPQGAPLARALAHAKARRVPETIAALLEAWRDHRAPELADLIDRATRLLPTYQATLPVEPKLAHAAWQAAFDRDPQGELPRLVRHLHAGGAAAATEHVVALAALPDDPRIASRLAEIATSHNISPERSQFWKTCWELIARTRDTRVIVPLRRSFGDFEGTYYDHHRSGKRLVGPFVLAEPPASTLDAKAFQAIGQLATALDGIIPAHVARERMLLADIVAHWADEGPRLVYADWLIQQDHLRGQLIVLACKKAREDNLKPAEGKLLTALRGGFRNPTYLFGPISDFEHVLDRGLPDRITANWRASRITWRHLAGDLLLPLIAIIDLEACHDDRGRPAAEDLARVMLDPTATRLTRVEGVPNEAVDRRRDARFEMHANERLADALEPLVKSQWKRDGRDFVRR